MLVPPTNNNIPFIALSANIPTEQAGRENKIRQPVAATERLDKTHPERKIDENDKQRRRQAWDPNEHPNYDELTEDAQSTAVEEPPVSELERLFQLLSLDHYDEGQGQGYVIRFRLPKRVLDEALQEGVMVKRRQVIRYHYGHSVSPNTPSDVIIVL